MTSVTEEPLSLKIHLQAAWWELPGTEEAVAELADSLLETAEQKDTARASLTRAIDAARNIAATLSAGSRQTNVLILQPHLGRVDALLSIRVCRVSDDAYANYRGAALALASSEKAEFLSRSVEEIRLPTGPAIVSSDILVPLGGSGGIAPSVTERAFLALFPAGWDAMVEFTLATQDLGVFANVREYLVELASGYDASTDGAEVDAS